jgi:hypothetical protein
LLKNDGIVIDFEANPYVLEEGLEYMIAVPMLPAPDEAEPSYDSFERPEKKYSKPFIVNVLDRCKKGRDDAHLPLPHLTSDGDKSLGMEGALTRSTNC